MSITDTFSERLPGETVRYWLDVSRLLLTLAAAIATILFLFKGGNLVRLSPAV